MPKVSVIIPCYNEEKTIGLLLEAIYTQSYPRGEIEVVIADGKSTDHTRGVIAEFQGSHPGLAVQVAENPHQAIPAALNTAIRACRGDYILRLDAHSVPAADYVERSVAALDCRLGAVVGGVWQIQPGGAGWIARAIAAAAANPLGVGDALYRFTTRAGQVDTVPFGAYARALIDQVGFYDETLLVNEDYEFNTRVRQSGGKVWLDPAIHSVYFARSDLAALSRQYFRYGFWKFRMLRRYPGTLRWRQALPPIFLLNLVLLAVLAIFLPLAGLGLALELGLYALILLAAGIQQASKRKDRGLVAGIPLAIATMHLSWGWGFLVSVVKSGLTK
jgi:glycosyltransferase involved in cell wall biosynthesis